MLAEDALGRPGGATAHPAAGSGRNRGEGRQPAGQPGRPVGSTGLWTAVRSTGPALNELVKRGGKASRDRRKGALGVADCGSSGRRAGDPRRRSGPCRRRVARRVAAAVGVLDAHELPIHNYDDLNVNDAVAAIKELTAAQRRSRDHRLRRGAQEPPEHRLGGADSRRRDRARKSSASASTSPYANPTSAPGLRGRGPFGSAARLGGCHRIVAGPGRYH